MPFGPAQLLLSPRRSMALVSGVPLVLCFLTFCSEMADPIGANMRVHLKLGGFLGFTAGFLMAYQRSSSAFISWQLPPQCADDFPFQCASGDGQKTNARKNGISRSLDNVSGTESHCTASLLSLCGCNMRQVPTRSGRSSNSVRGIHCHLMSYDFAHVCSPSHLPNVRSMAVD